MIALFCRLYKTKRMQHMSCILCFVSTFRIILTTYQFSFDIPPPKLKVISLVSGINSFIFQIVQYFFLRYTWILQQVPCYSCTYSGDRIGGSFLIFIASVCAYIYCFTAKIPQRTYGIPVFIKISSCHADYFFPGSRIYLAPRRCLKLRFPAAASIRTPFSLAY